MAGARQRLAGKKDLQGLTPDEWDEKNIRNLIALWDKVHPAGRVRWMPDNNDPNKLYMEYLNVHDHVKYMRGVVKQERKLKAVRAKKGDPIGLRLSLPPAFAAKLREAYPTLLTDKKQCSWFLRKFPEFDLEK